MNSELSDTWEAATARMQASSVPRRKLHLLAIRLGPTEVAQALAYPRWVLKDSQGKFLADQEVRLDSSDPNYSAFIDLEGFLKANSSPDRWLEDQIRMMPQVGV